MQLDAKFNPDGLSVAIAAGTPAEPDAKPETAAAPAKPKAAKKRAVRKGDK